MAGVQETTYVKALAPTFKSQAYVGQDNDPEPALAAELPQRTGTVVDHQTACAENWRKATDAYLAEMDPPHTVAIDGTAGGKLYDALVTAFAEWYNSGTWTCDPLRQAFVAMSKEIADNGEELHTDLLGPDLLDTEWEWVSNTAPSSAGPDLCDLEKFVDSDTPFTTGAERIVAKVHEWFIKGQSTYQLIDPPNTVIVYDWEGNEV